MGGLAVAIEWSTSSDKDRFGRMCSTLAHRATAGLRTVNLGSALLGEARLGRDGRPGWTIDSLGSLTIVGDIRLWKRDRLEAIAGMAAGSDLSDRELLLHAYRRRGLNMMDAVDGDFSFAIWDEGSRCLVAARDRFGVKPLFVRRTATGLHLGSEPKTIVAGDDRPQTPSQPGVAQYLTGEFFNDTLTAIDGIERLMPAHVLVVTEHSLRTNRYWNLRDVESVDIRGTDASDLFRHHLVASVSRRLERSRAVVSQLSGGMDSTSIAASASILTQSGLSSDRFSTMSVRFPGTTADESPWIDDVVTTQPFTHFAFDHETATIDMYASDMTEIDAPMANITRDIRLRSAWVAAETDADLVITGHGGDDVIGEDWLLADLLRSCGFGTWLRGLGTISSDSRQQAVRRGSRSLRLAAPRTLKSIGHVLQHRGSGPSISLMSTELTEVHRELRRTNSSTRTGSGREAMASALPSPRSLRTLEHADAQISTQGVEVSHPYLDRELVEFVASLSPADRPVGVRNKTLVRSAFDKVLPTSVVERHGKTYVNEVMESEYRQHTDGFVRRFPRVDEKVLPYVDRAAYQDILRAAQTTDLPLADLVPLWSTWSFMLWIDNL